MEDRFCPNCGTEVEADARFCPTCGSTLSADTHDQPDLPAAPAWPPPEPSSGEADEEAPVTEASIESQPEAVEAAAEREPEPMPEPEPEPKPVPEPTPPPPPPPPASPSAASGGGMPDLPITWPTTLSGWLIGAGSLLGALALIPRLGSVVSLLLFLALLGVMATVFLADRVPDVPRQQLAILVITMIGLGVGLARAGFTVQGVDTLLLVGMLAAAGGSLLIELDRDRPMPPPERTT